MNSLEKLNKTRREVVIIDTVRNIAHLVLLESAKYWGQRDVLLSPDDTRLAEASAANKARIWDTNTGALLLTLTLDGVFSVAFSPDGRKVSSASYYNTLNIWDTDTGALLTLEGHSDGVFSVAFSPDGRKVASASYYRVFIVTTWVNGDGGTCAEFSPSVALLLVQYAEKLNQEAAPAATLAPSAAKRPSPPRATPRATPRSTPARKASNAPSPAAPRSSPAQTI
jgi:hypothetical protein